MSTPDDPRLDEALDIIRAAVVGLKTALRLIGESRAQAAEEEKQEGPKHFPKGPVRGRKRPTTAVGAESQQAEG